MPEGSECRVVADAIAFNGIGKYFTQSLIVENIAGILHRYSKKAPKNWDVIQDGFTLHGVKTKGKLIHLDIDKNSQSWVLLCTLGMSGDFRWNSRNHRHCRYSFISTNEDLSFIDMRCFGTLRIVTPKEAKLLESKIGWDMLQAPMPEDDWTKLRINSNLMVEELADFLLSQKYISGIGNIYRAETLYRTGLHPKLKLMQVSPEKWQELNITMHEVLQAAYKLNGCSVSDFTANGVEGRAQQLLQVYGKSQCSKGHVIQTLKQNERTIWFCSICQPLA